MRSGFMRSGFCNSISRYPYREPYSRKNNRNHKKRRHFLQRLKIPVLQIAFFCRFDYDSRVKFEENDKK